jgi:serine/threonine protein kinase
MLLVLLPPVVPLLQGTLTHMAPELLLTGRASQASDMYAAGILLWELVTGLRPWEGVGPALLPARVVQQGARPLWPPGCEQHIPQRLRALTEAAWAQEPAAR